MDEQEFLDKYIHPFTGVEYIFDERGYCVWRMGTGNNYEWLHFRLFAGFGLLELFREMLVRMSKVPPYHSVFAFTRVSNSRAIAMHKFLGFETQQVDGVYKDGNAILSWQEFQVLCEKHKINHS